MYTAETKVRVRYGETDKMGYVYYGIYAQYYEIGRTELMRKLGFPYKKIEDLGIMLPVISLDIKYFKAAIYDDLLTIRTTLKEIPSARITFFYEIMNANDEILNEGSTTLVFIDEKTRRPRRGPKEMIDRIGPYFK